MEEDEKEEKEEEEKEKEEKKEIEEEEEEEKRMYEGKMNKRLVEHLNIYKSTIILCWIIIL